MFNCGTYGWVSGIGMDRFGGLEPSGENMDEGDDEQIHDMRERGVVYAKSASVKKNQSCFRAG